MSCFICQLIVGIDVLDMQGNVLLCGIVDLCQLSLREPYILVSKAHVLPYQAVVVLVNDEVIVIFFFLPFFLMIIIKYNSVLNAYDKYRLRISAFLSAQLSITFWAWAINDS